MLLKRDKALLVASSQIWHIYSGEIFSLSMNEVHTSLRKAPILPNFFSYC